RQKIENLMEYLTPEERLQYEFQLLEMDYNELLELCEEIEEKLYGPKNNLTELRRFTVAFEADDLEPLDAPLPKEDEPSKEETGADSTNRSLRREKSKTIVVMQTSSNRFTMGNRSSTVGPGSK